VHRAFLSGPIDVGQSGREKDTLHDERLVVCVFAERHDARLLSFSKRKEYGKGDSF